MIKEIPNINEPDGQTIKELEYLLEIAKSGELKGIAYSYSCHEGVAHGWAGAPTRDIIGSLEELKFDFFSRMYFPTED